MERKRERERGEEVVRGKKRLRDSN